MTEQSESTTFIRNMPPHRRHKGERVNEVASGKKTHKGERLNLASIEGSAQFSEEDVILSSRSILA
eukprot:scaffold231060_cov66-Cyclotella_meneghiniana.AAC.2